MKNKRQKDQKKVRQFRLGLVAVLLIVLAILLFAVSRSTNLYGFAKGKSNYVKRVQLLKRRGATPTTKPGCASKVCPSGTRCVELAHDVNCKGGICTWCAPALKATPTPAKHQACSGTNMACPKGQYCFITNTVGLPKGFCIKPGESIP